MTTLWAQGKTTLKNDALQIAAKTHLKMTRAGKTHQTPSGGYVFLANYVRVHTRASTELCAAVKIIFRPCGARTNKHPHLQVPGASNFSEKYIIWVGGCVTCQGYIID